MKTPTIKATLLSVALACSAVAAAQGHTELPNQPYLSLSEQSAWLLNYATIRDNLKLSNDEKKVLDTESSSYTAAQQRLFTKGSPSEQQIETLDHAHARTVLAGLTQVHRDRLYQILLQAKGSEAFADRTVATHLGLNATELAQIHQILKTADDREEEFEANLAKKLLAVPRIAPSSLYQQKRLAVIDAAKPERATLEKQRAADEAKALGLLTKPQKGKWKELTGAPFPLTRYKD
jgi:hypothetical protein